MKATFPRVRGGAGGLHGAAVRDLAERLGISGVTPREACALADVRMRVNQFLDEISCWNLLWRRGRGPCRDDRTRARHRLRFRATS